MIENRSRIFAREHDDLRQSICDHACRCAHRRPANPAFRPLTFRVDDSRGGGFPGLDWIEATAGGRQCLIADPDLRQRPLWTAWVAYIDGMRLVSKHR